MVARVKNLDGFCPEFDEKRTFFRELLPNSFVSGFSRFQSCRSVPFKITASFLAERLKSLLRFRDLLTMYKKNANLATEALASCEASNMFMD